MEEENIIHATWHKPDDVPIRPNEDSYPLKIIYHSGIGTVNVQYFVYQDLMNKYTSQELDWNRIWCDFVGVTKMTKWCYLWEVR